MLVCVVGGVVGGDVVGVDSLSEIEIFHPLRKQQIIITLTMLVYTRFERMRFHTMLIKLCYGNRGPVLKEMRSQKL